ncbi:hypothetical protein XENOCAPTIV_001685, partial [Xenoophorus captivus]
TTQLRTELVSCTEDRDELSQSLGQWRDKVHGLEKTNCDTRNLISILEDDIRVGKKEYEALQSSVERVKEEREQSPWLEKSRLGRVCVQTFKSMGGNWKCMLSEEGRSSEELKAEATQLRAEDRKKEVEELMSALKKMKTEAEEREQEFIDKDKEVKDLTAALEGMKKKMEEKERELEEIGQELDKVNTLLEEKSTEADESMEKYCSLMVKVHKLEESNDALKSRLEQATANQHANEAKIPSETCRRSARKSSSKHQEEKTNENTENVVPTATPSSPQGSSPGKRGHNEISDRDSAQEALHNLTKKLKANAMTPRARGEQEDEEFRPEGLSDLVQKGQFSVFFFLMIGTGHHIMLL